IKFHQKHFNDILCLNDNKLFDEHCWKISLTHEWYSDNRMMANSLRITIENDNQYLFNKVVRIINEKVTDERIKDFGLLSFIGSILKIGYIETKIPYLWKHHIFNDIDPY